MNNEHHKAYARGYAAGKRKADSVAVLPRTDASGRTFSEFVAAQVSWYRKFGSYPMRIARDSAGIEYVIGDYSWNRGGPLEDIEHRMSKDGL